jgi:putative ABC transport system substrate-binding protein
MIAAWCVRLTAAAMMSSALLGSGNLALAQQNPPRVKRIGVALSAYSPESAALQAFRRGLEDAGYADGRDLVLDIRSVQGDPDQADAVVGDLLANRIDILVVESTAIALAAKRATRSIPIVLAFVADPVGSGIVSNLSRPGGNITGLSNMTLDLATKRLQLLKDAVPAAKRIGVIWNPDTPWHRRAVDQLQAAAVGLGVALEPVATRIPADIAPAFATLTRVKIDALLIVDSPFVGLHSQAIMRGVRRSRLPTAHWSRDLLKQGLLIAYGPDPVDIFRRASAYVDRILRGAKPGDLPIAQPTKFELLISLRTADTLGIEVPESLLLRADEVIR